MTNACSQTLSSVEGMDMLCTQAWPALATPPRRLLTSHRVWTPAALQQHALPVQSGSCASSVRLHPLLLPLPTGACQPRQLISQQAKHDPAWSRFSPLARALRGRPQCLFWRPARAGAWAPQPRRACSPACHTSCLRCVLCRLTPTPRTPGPPGPVLCLPPLGRCGGSRRLPECGWDICHCLQQASAQFGRAGFVLNQFHSTWSKKLNRLTFIPCILLPQFHSCMVLPRCMRQKLVMTYNGTGMAQGDASGVAVRGGAACMPLMMYRGGRGLGLQLDLTESQPRAVLISGVPFFLIQLRTSGLTLTTGAPSHATLAHVGEPSHT